MNLSVLNNFRQLANINANRHSLCALACVCLIIFCVPGYAYAKEKKAKQAQATEQNNPPSSIIEIEFLGIEGQLKDNVRKNVRLVQRLKDPTPISVGELRRLKRRAPNEIQKALEPFGYYLSEVSLRPKSASSSLIYDVVLNEPLRINQLSLNIDDGGVAQAEFAEWRRNYSLKVGDVLQQTLYEQDKKVLAAQALRLGYFDAAWLKHEIVVDEKRTSADIKLEFVSGKRYLIGDVLLTWDTDSSPDLKKKSNIENEILAPLISMKPGDVFNSDELVKTQGQLLGTPYFSNVSVLTGAKAPTDSSVIINIVLTPAKRKAYSLEAGVGTDTGIRGGVGYEDRRINRKGHTVGARIGASEITRSAIANYRIPLRRSRKDSINSFVSLEEQVGDSRQFEARKIGTELLRGWHGSLLKFGLTASREKYTRALETGIETEQETDLLMPSFGWERIKANDLYAPTKGWSGSFKLRGASEALASDIDLVQAIADAKFLYPLGIGRLKFRLKVARSIIDESVDLPESLGFLAGGDDSVRGYKFESIGVQRERGIAVGKHLVATSVEYEHPIKNGISLAAFFDAGDAFNANANLKKGAGLGLRWRLPFGVMRLDVASALDLDGDPFRLHFSFGTDL